MSKRMRIGNFLSEFLCRCVSVLISHTCHSFSSLPCSLPSLGIKRVMRHILFFFIFSQQKPSGCIFRIFCIKISPRTDPTGQKEAEIFNLFLTTLPWFRLSYYCKRDSEVVKHQLWMTQKGCRSITSFIIDSLVHWNYCRENPLKG